MTNDLYFCAELNDTLTCFHDKITSCCSSPNGPIYIQNYNGKNFDFEILKQKKLEFFSLFNEENIKDSPCYGCFSLRKRTPEDLITTKYKMLHVSHWTHCNCGCIYCARMKDSHGKITHRKEKSEYYDMLPVVKQLYKNDLLDRENLIVCIQGGDISVLKEFDKLVKEFMKQGLKQFYFLSNNINYQPIIKKLLDQNKASYTTSLDCASRDLYYKLKRVDKFDESVKNLRKYAKGNQNPPITVKYIIVEHLNDNIQEMKNFVDLMVNCGIYNIELMIDNKYVLCDHSKVSIPKHYGELYLFFKDYCKKQNINFVIWDKVEYIINKYLL